MTLYKTLSYQLLQSAPPVTSTMQWNITCIYKLKVPGTRATTSEYEAKKNRLELTRRKSASMERLFQTQVSVCFQFLHTLLFVFVYRLVFYKYIFTYLSVLKIIVQYLTEFFPRKEITKTRCHVSFESHAITSKFTTRTNLAVQ